MKREDFIVVLLFLALVLFFFYKIFLGLIPLPTDLIVGGYYPWLDYKWGYEVGVPVKNPLLTDAVSLVYPLKNLVAEYLKRGEMPLWNPYMFAGYPLIASLPAAIFFPSTLFYLFLSTPVAWTIQIMLQPLSALIFMFLLLKHWRLGTLASFFGAVVFAFGGFSLIWLEWGTHTQTAAFLPLMILLADKLRESKRLWWGSLISMVFALQIFAGYTPSVIFSLFALFIWYLLSARLNFRLGLKLFIFMVLGLGVASIQLLPSYELFQLSQRQYEILPLSEIFWPIQYLMTLVIPDFFGSPATGNFWGAGNYTNVTLFTGIISLIAALTGALLNKNSIQVKFALFLLAATLLISIQNPLSELLYSLGVWGGGSMTMNRSLFLINFAVAILAALGVKSLLFKTARTYLLINFLIFAILLFISLFLFVIGKIWVNDQLAVAFRNSVLPTLFAFASLSAVLITLKLKKNYWGVYLLTGLLVVELFRFGWKYNTFSSPNFLYPSTPVIEYLQNYPDDRFLSEQITLSPNLWMPFDLSSISGYEAVYPVDIAKLIAVTNSHNLSASPQTKAGNITNLTSPLIDQTNTRFLVILKRDGKEIKKDGQLPEKYLVEKYKKVFEDQSSVVLENRDYKPRVFMAEKVIKSNHEDSLKKMLEEKDRQIAYTENFEFKQSAGSLSKITSFKQIKGSRIQIRVNASEESFLVVLNTFYPGWKAYLNNTELEIIKTNYAFMGLKIPEGENLIDLVYTPNSFEVGLKLSLISILLLTIVFLYEVRATRSGKNL